MGLLILLLLVQPVKGPSGDSLSGERGKSTANQINTNQHKDAAANNLHQEPRPCASCQVGGKDQKQSEEATQPSNQKRDGFDWNPILAVATILLAFFALCQAIISRNTASRQLRAYVSVVPALAEDGSFVTITNTEFGIATFGVANEGTTPAHDVTMWIRADIRNRTETQFNVDASPEDDPYFGIMYMKSVNILRARALPLNSEIINELQTGRKDIFYWGRVDYKDAFRKPHKTLFRYYVRWTGEFFDLPRPSPGGCKAT